MKRALLPALLVAMLSMHCVRETTIDLPDQPTKLVAISHFSLGQPIQVEVSLSQSLTDAGDPVIPFNADVSIAVGGKFLDKLFRVTDDGGRIYWESRDLVEPHTQYALAVRVPGYPPIEAIGQAPDPVRLQPSAIDT
ncbi:MAG: DUF4249 family protein, partial [Saprospiraceae bacterium]|nr:DUF4249 family protein [Saprospiraceae bacterium]